MNELRRMQALVQALWRLEGPSVMTHVGDLAWGPTHRVFEPAWRTRLWEGAGCAWIRRPGSLEYELLPAQRGGPLEDEILDWFAAESEGLELRTYSLSTDVGRLAFLERRGYRVDETATGLDLHVRALGDEPMPVVREGFRLRTVQPGDLERRVEVHRAAWEPSRVTVATYRNVMATWPYRADLDCVVEAPDGLFAASCIAWLDPENGVGELEPVGTHPRCRRLGLGSAVCRFALRRLREEGAQQAIVYSNTPPARALYQSIGFRVHARAIELVKG